MKGCTVTSGGRVGWTIFMQFVVIEVVALGLMRRMLIVVGVAILWYCSGQAPGYLDDPGFLEFERVCGSSI